MDKNLRIQVILSALDKVTGPLRSIGGASSKTRSELRATQAQLSALAKQNKLLNTFRQLKTSTGQLDAELDQARARATTLGRELSEVTRPTRKMTREFTAARREVDRLETAQGKQQRALNAVRGELKGAGLEAGKFVSHQRRIQTETAEATRALEKQKDKLKKLDDQQHRMAKGRAVAGRIQGAAGATAIAGGAALAGGLTAARPFMSAADRTRDFRSGLTDIGLKANIDRPGRAELGGFLLDQSRRTNQLPEELRAGFDTLVSNGLDAKEARILVNPVAKAATAWGTAFEDVANTDFALLDKMELTAQQIGQAHDIMSYAGKEGAFEQSDMAASFPELTASFKAMRQKGLPALADLAAGAQAVKKNTGSAATAANNLKNLLDKLSSPEVERNFKKVGVNLPAELKKANAEGRPLLDTVVELTKRGTKGDESRLGYLFGDVQARDAIRALWQNQAFYNKIRLEALQAQGQVDNDFDDRMQDSASLQKALEIRRQIAEIQAGSPVLELEDSAAKPLSDLADKVGAFAAKHPGLVKIAAVCAVILVVVGAIAIAVAALLAPFAVFAIIAAAGFLPVIAIVLAVAAAIAVLAYGAVLLWRKLVWTFEWWADAWNKVKAKALEFIAWFKGIPLTFEGIGRAMIQGLILGIRTMFPMLRTEMGTVTSLLPQTVKDKLGIRSPSRVFAGIGQDTMDGLAVGIRRGRRGPLDDVRFLAGQLAGSLALGAAISASPVSAAAGGGGGSASYVINVYATPGMDEGALARAVAAELDRRERARASQQRAGFQDYGD